MTTEQTPNIPSQNPAANGNLGAVVMTVIRKEFQSMNNQLPAVVISYDRATNLAQVQPQIAMLTTGGKTIQRAPIAAVPVLALGGGGFFINFPLKAGDRGWIEASDRDISLYLQSGQNSLPNTKRMHTFEDGRFIPDAFNQYTVETVDATSMVISSVDGTVRIALSPNKITHTAPTVEFDATTVNINATNLNTNVTGTITENAGAKNTTVTGDIVELATNVTIAAHVKIPQDLTITGVPFHNHVHSGGTLAGGLTGVVTP